MYTRLTMSFILLVYQKTVPASIFALLMELTSLDLEAGKDVPTSKPSAADVDDETPAVTAGPASTTASTSAAPPAGTAEASAAPEVLAASADPEAPAVSASETSASVAEEPESSSVSVEGNGSGTEWETLTDEGKAAQAA
jgi:hypothetical protein